jgi:hypothetical protein
MLLQLGAPYLSWWMEILIKKAWRIQILNLIRVGLLNHEAVIKLIDGIDDEEMADLAINLLSCKTCKIAIVRYDKLSNCSIVKIFDENNKHKVACGKKKLEGLNIKEGERNTWYANFK